jgi:hypothetical protein
MHADTKVRFKLILAATDPAAAGEQWAALDRYCDACEDNSGLARGARLCRIRGT